MKFPEVEALLAIITGLDRRPFPPGAAATWFRVLEKTAFDDAKQAVVDYFDTAADEVPVLLPGRVRRGAALIAERQAALAARQALPAAPAEPTEEERARSDRQRAEAMAAIRAATAQAVANVRRRDPDLKPYKHRAGALTRVA
jgi:hypothetical protein